MSHEFEFQLSSLPEPQRRLWPELMDVPGEFILYGGTAVALQLGHRISIDFDFFTSGAFDPDRLLQSLPFLANATVLQKGPDTLTTSVDRGGPVQISFFSVPRLGRVRAPLVADEINLNIASLIDLAGTKVAVVQKRAEAKDYIDMDAIIEHARIDLSTALAAAKIIYGSQFNPEMSLKALTFFGDGNLPSVPPNIQANLIAAVKGVDLDKLPRLEPLKTWASLENRP